MSDCLCLAKRMSQSFVGFAAPDAVNGRFKTSHLWALQNRPPVSGVRVPILTLPTFVSCSKHQEPTRLSFPARDDRSPGCESHPDRLKPPLVRALRAGGALAGKDGPGGGGNLGDESMAAWLTR